MTERQWLASGDARELVPFACDGTGDRKLRLFACACCRQLWNPFIDPLTVGLISLAEAYADGPVNPATLRRFHARGSAATRRAERTRKTPSYVAHLLHVATLAVEKDIGKNLQPVCHFALRAAADLPVITSPAQADAERLENWPALAEYQAEQAAQADLLRDIFGNPFRPVSFSPQWRISDAVALAKQMYESRDFSAMPILADALQDAGCDNEDILAHCRDPKQVHVRGCWVVDLVLGKE